MPEHHNYNSILENRLRYPLTHAKNSVLDIFLYSAAEFHIGFNVQQIERWIPSSDLNLDIVNLGVSLKLYIVDRRSSDQSA